MEREPKDETHRDEHSVIMDNRQLHCAISEELAVLAVVIALRVVNALALKSCQSKIPSRVTQECFDRRRNGGQISHHE
jgi:hypothetical protein